MTFKTGSDFISLITTDGYADGKEQYLRNAVQTKAFKGKAVKGVSIYHTLLHVIPRAITWLDRSYNSLPADKRNSQ
jgi:hypothetical protein